MSRRREARLKYEASMRRRVRENPKELIDNVASTINSRNRDGSSRAGVPVDEHRLAHEAEEHERNNSRDRSGG